MLSSMKVRACEHVLNYKYTNDISELDKAVPLLEEGLEHYRRLVAITNKTYHYANSMQTSMRRVPIAGDDGKMKHWSELLPKYEEELANLKKNIAQLKSPSAGVKKQEIKPLRNAKVVLAGDVKTVKVEKGAKLFNDLDSVITDYGKELEGMQAYVFSSKAQRNEGTVVEFSCDKPVTLLVGYFRDDQRKYARAPKLEIDATASEYGQQDPCFTSALRINGMPQVNVHPYNFAPGKHRLQLPKGFLVVLGYTSDKINPRDAGLSGADSSIDWLFY